MAYETRDNELERTQQPVLNRAMRRLQARQEARRSQAAVPVRERRRPTPPPARERVGPRQFGREVRSELRKVAWPTRSEVINSTVVVLIAVTVLTALIFGFDFVLGKFVLYLYD